MNADINFGTVKFFDRYVNISLKNYSNSSGLQQTCITKCIHHIFSSVATSDNIKKLELSMSSLDLTVPSAMDDETTKDSGFLEAIPTTSTGISHRSLRTRKSISYQEDKLRAIKGRGIERSRKSSTSAFTNASFTKEDIKQIYLNNKVGKMKVTLLETIFEENLPEAPVASNNFNVFGRKLKRSLSCSDGQNITKTLKEKRKRRAKKMSAMRLGRIPMDTFRDRLRLMHQCDDDDDLVDDVDLIPIERPRQAFSLRRSMSDSSATTFHSDAVPYLSDDDEDDST